MLRRLWRDETGQDIAEYALMLAILLTITVIFIESIGNSATQVFSRVASTMAEVI